jgi:hypothetical protein
MRVGTANAWRRPGCFIDRSVLLLAAFLVAGCASQQREVQAQAEADAKDDAKCQSSGFQPGTAAYDQCLAKLADLRAQADRSAISARLLNHPPPWAKF